jgi:hypothetical protein
MDELVVGADLILDESDGVIKVTCSAVPEF